MSNVSAGDVAVCGLCQKPALQKCSACKHVAYCSREHQKSDWKAHKNQCRPFEVERSVEVGRCLVAIRELKPRDTILQEAPLVVGPRLGSPSPSCLGCLCPLAPDMAAQCPRCLWPSCSVKCPALSTSHQPECAILSQCHTNPRYEAITPLRCLLLQTKNPRKWKQLMAMEAHMDQRGPDTEVYKELEEYVVDYLKSNFFSKLPSGLLTDTSEETLHKVCGVLDVNALEIGELLALYPTAYVMEHSCLPNTHHYFNQHSITVIAANYIPIGAHIRTMYTHALWGTAARLEHLRATKYFTCKCSRCADPTELGTYLSALKCLGEGPTPNSVCSDWQLCLDPLDDNSDWQCGTCHMVLDAQQVSMLLANLSTEVEETQQKKPTVKDLQNLIRKLEMLVHPNHYLCYTVQHSLIQLYGHEEGYLHHQLSDELLKRKQDVCRSLLAVTNKIDPSSCRLSLYSGVLLYELHSALVEQSNRSGHDTVSQTEATQCLLKAADILRYESQPSPGADMLRLVKKSLNNVN